MEPLTPRWRSQEEDRSGQSVERNSEFGWGSVQLEVLKNTFVNIYKLGRNIALSRTERRELEIQI